jgi:hypothetical protein
MTDTATRREQLDRAAANARVRRCRLRLAGLLPPVPRCVVCGCRATAADPDESSPVCSSCWRLTDAGRQWNRERVRLARQARRTVSGGAE